MIKTISYCGLKFQQVTPKKQQPYYIVSADKGKYIYKVKTFAEATLILNEMADNNDIADEMMHRICEKFNCNVYGGSYGDNN